MIPFLDLKAQYAPMRAEIAAAIQQVLDSCAFSGGPFVEKFEREWAGYCNVKRAIGVGSGTEALWLALLALKVGQGDEVITVPSTFMATAEAISMTGATPVFVDVEHAHYTMDPDLLEAAITPQTKAVIPVHLFGQTADMDSIMTIARRHGLFVIEDACQAHGAVYKGRKAGSIGDAGAFSFYPGKNLGAYGEAGAVTTNDDDVASRIRMLRDHGQSRKYCHDLAGWNARMDGMQAAVLSVKLQYLDIWNEKRRQCAAAYAQGLQDNLSIRIPASRSQCEHVYHLFVVQIEDRDAVMSDLRQQGIGFGIHYPVPVHLTGAYASLGYGRGSFPVSERLADEGLSLPMFAELTQENVASVIRAVAGAVRQPA